MTEQLSIEEFRPNPCGIEVVGKICEKCEQPFVFQARNPAEKKWVNHCEECWAEIDAEREVKYQDLLTQERNRGLRSSFPQELLTDWKSELCPEPGLYSACSIWIPDEKYHGLYIFGRNGIGKTRIACLLAVEVAAMIGKHPTYKSWPAMIAEITTFGGRGVNAVFQELDRLQLLVLDDFLAGGSPSAKEELLAYNVINSRSLSRRPTIITTNVEPGQISRLSMTHQMRAVESRIAYGYMKKGIVKQA